MEILENYVIAFIVAFCFGVGYIIRHAIPTDKINRFIPLIMGCLGIFLNIWVSHWQISPEIVLGGLASGLASTGANELVKHLFTEGQENDK